MKKIKKYIILTVFCAVLALLTGCVGDNHVKILYSSESQEEDKEIRWLQVQKGLAYANVLANFGEGGRKELFLVKIDPHFFEFRVFNNEDENDAKTLKQIHKESDSVLTFNGAFFDTDFEPLGLLQDSTAISHKQINSELMNGVFAVANRTNENKVEKLAKVHPLEKTPKDKESFMIQNGPILIDEEGNIPLTKDTGKLAARTAIGVDGEGNVVLIVLHQSLLNADNAISLYQFAHLLKDHPLFVPMGLHSVLNLDGGPSTGVLIGGEYLPEISNVQNAIITLPRSREI